MKNRYESNPLISGIPSIPASMAEIYKMLTSAPPPPTEEDRRADKLVRQMMLTTLDKVYIPTARDIRSAISIFRMIVTGYEMRQPTAGYWREHEEACQQTGKPNVPNAAGSACAPAQAILGVSGAGKSTSIENALCRIPQVIQHDQKQHPLLPRQQIVWIKVTCPVNRTPRAFITEFFESVDRLTGANYSSLSKSKQNDDQLIVGMAKIARAHFLGLLVIDEIQNVVAKNPNDERRLLKLFVNMTGTLRIPILFVGTPKSQRVLSSELADARRMLGPQWLPFTSDASDWNLILDKHWPYQWTRQETPLTDELRAKIFEFTQGIPALAKALYALAQTRLILNSSKSDPEKITPGLLSQTFEQDMGPVHGAVHALATRTGAAAFDDLLPANFDQPEKDKERERIVAVGRTVFEDAFVRTAKRAGREEANILLRRTASE